MENDINSTRTRVQGIQKDAENLSSDLNKAKSTLAAASALEPKVNMLSGRVAALEGIANVSHGIPPNVEARISSALLAYNAYLRRIGFKIPDRLPTLEMNDQGESSTSFHLFENVIVLGTDIEHHPDSALWGYTESVMDSVLKPKNDRASLVANSFADYYVSSS